jgi:hypothetical protein
MTEKAGILRSGTSGLGSRAMLRRSSDKPALAAAALSVDFD